MDATAEPVSPATARALDEGLDGTDLAPRAMPPVVARRAIREAGAGRSHVHDHAESARRRRLVLALLVLALVILPAVLVQRSVGGQ